MSCFPSSRFAINQIRYSYHYALSLVIPSISVKDAGTYKCISKNSLGRTEGAIRVYGEDCSQYSCFRDSGIRFTEIIQQTEEPREVEEEEHYATTVQQGESGKNG